MYIIDHILPIVNSSHMNYAIIFAVVIWNITKGSEI